MKRKFMKRKFGIEAVALATLLALSPAAKAGFLDTVLTPNTLNVFEDNVREALVDVDNSGTLSIGDVAIGFVRIELRSAPTAIPFSNNIYAIFSQQFVAFTGPFGAFGPTTVPGLTLDAILTSGLGTTTSTGATFPPLAAPANAAVAVFSTAASGAIGDLISAPGALPTLNDYFDKIKAGSTLDLVAGFGAGDDFITSIGLIPATFDGASIGPLCTTGLLCLTGTRTIASTTGGLSILQNFTAFNFAELVLSDNPLAGPSLHQLGISGGSTTGGSDDPFFDQFGDASGFGGGPHNQCQAGTSTVNLPCGARGNLDIGVFPTSVVPEPGILALLGIGLLGFVGMRRRVNGR